MFTKIGLVCMVQVFIGIAHSTVELNNIFSFGYISRESSEFSVPIKIWRNLRVIWFCHYCKKIIMILLYLIGKLAFNKIMTD